MSICSHDSIARVGYDTFFSLCSVTILSSNTHILFSVGLVLNGTSLCILFRWCNFEFMELSTLVIFNIFLQPNLGNLFEQVTFFVFNPAFVYTNLSKTITFESMVMLWVSFNPVYNFVLYCDKVNCFTAVSFLPARPK